MPLFFHCYRSNWSRWPGYYHSCFATKMASLVLPACLEYLEQIEIKAFKARLDETVAFGI